MKIIISNKRIYIYAKEILKKKMLFFKFCDLLLQNKVNKTVSCCKTECT